MGQVKQQLILEGADAKAYIEGYTKGANDDPLMPCDTHPWCRRGYMDAQASSAERELVIQEINKAWSEYASE